MRTTQFIGLTKKANKFVGKKGVVRSSKVLTEGMFGEPVYGYYFTMPDGEVYQEVVQASPWSSGPMIFTCLVRKSTGEKMFEWVEDESVRNEVDYERGRFCV